MFVWYFYVRRCREGNLYLRYKEQENGQECVKINFKIFFVPNNIRVIMWEIMWAGHDIEK
jgi:macrodomain Ter protein organizer (MatP/YcbG family)